VNGKLRYEVIECSVATNTGSCVMVGKVFIIPKRSGNIYAKATLLWQQS